jgi:hypothetical protein
MHQRVSPKYWKGTWNLWGVYIQYLVPVFKVFVRRQKSTQLVLINEFDWKTHDDGCHGCPDAALLRCHENVEDVCFASACDG